MAMQNPQVTSSAPELAAYFVKMGILSLYILNCLKGNLRNIDKYIASRSWSFLKGKDDESTGRYLKFFKGVIIVFIFMPLITLAVWVAALFYTNVQAGSYVIGPISVLLVGLAVMCFSLGIFYIKWNLYKFSMLSLFYLLASVGFFFAYQICGNFVNVSFRSFFCISAIFLSYNNIVFMVVIFLNSGNNVVNFNDVLEKNLDEQPEGASIRQEEDLAQQLQAQQKDPKYVLTKEELAQFYTIKPEDEMLLDGGIVREFANLSLTQQLTISLGIYIFSVGILVGYAFIIYNTTAEYKLGFITLIATLTTDTIIACIAYTGMSQSVLQLCFLSIVFRACLYGFGGTYWFYGYCLLYFILGVIVCYNISASRFPLIDALQAETAESLSGRFNLSSQYMRNLMKSPEFILIYSTVVFGVLTLVLDIVLPDGVPLPSLYSSTTEYKFWTMAILSFGGVILSYLLMAIIRMLIRKRQNIIDTVLIYFFAPFFDIFWIHCYLCYGLFIIGGLIAYALSGNNIPFIVCCFLPLMVILLMYVYFYYCANDYRILRDIAAENEKRAYLSKMQKARAAKHAAAKQRRAAILQEKVPPIKEEKKETLDKPNTIPAPDSPSNVPKPSEEHKSPIQNPDVSDVDDMKTQNNYTHQIAKEDKDNIETALEALEEIEPLEDWTLTYNPFMAFLKGKLHPNDYRIIFGVVGIILLIFFNSFSIQISNNLSGGWQGVSLGFILFDSFIVFATLFKFLRTDLPFDIGQIIALAFGILVHIAYGIVYFGVHEGGDMDIDQNQIWVWFYVIFAPAFIAITTGVYKYYHRNWAVNPFTIVMTAVTFGLIVVFTVMLWVRIGWTAGIVTLVIDALILYAAGMSYLYAVNNYYFSFWFKASNITIIILACCAAMIVSWKVPNFEPFIGFTISYALIAGGALVYFFIRLVSLINHRLTEPTFFSPYVFPVFRYVISSNTCISYNYNIVGLFVTLVAALFWSILFSIYLQPMNVGISVGAIILVLTTFLTMYLTTHTTFALQDCQDEITSEIITQSWLGSKKKYIQHHNAITLKDLSSYSEVKQFYDAICNPRTESGGSESLQLNAKFLPPNIDFDKMSDKDRDKLLFQIEEEMIDRYMDEINLMVDFQLLCMMGVIAARMAFQTKTVNFLNAKGADLKTYGIDIKYKGIADNTVRHSMIMAQYKKLTPEQQAKYNELLGEYEKEQENVNAQHEENERKAREAEELRNKKLMELEKEKEKKKAELPNQSDLPIDQMLDSTMKYEKILTQFKQDKKPYEDKQFVASDTALGDEEWKTNRGISGWKKAADEMLLYDENISPFDVRQGALGDCYFISAISVLGETHVKDCLVSKPDDIKCGAFCVRFHKAGEEEEYVIIDNQFPLSGEEWSFAKSENSKELWPMVIEKAYAKLYGGFSNIEAGKVHYALAELTGGAAEQILLDAVAGNKDAFWIKILGYYKNGYLMGAGTPPNEMGDRAVNENGIVQGHAYSVLELNEYEGEQLIRLRNPHGSVGVEWNGDWSDGSPKWTEAAKAKLKYDNKDDGAFWMPLTDFLTEYKNLYICRTFDSKWKSLRLDVFKHFS